MSGVTVVVGVFLAQHLADLRKRAADERAAADAVLLEVANVRDAAVHSRSKSRSGRYDLWPLRHRIYLSHSLRSRPVLGAVENYYEAVWALRDWVRHGPVAQGDLAADDPRASQPFRGYQRALDQWAGSLIEALKAPEQPLSKVAASGPNLPTLP